MTRSPIPCAVSTNFLKSSGVPNLDETKKFSDVIAETHNMDARRLP